MRLYQLADIYLDSITWSGGMTTLEALGCALPIVTLPGTCMRGRHAYGCLTRLGIMETVASNVDEYVHIAVRLATDPVYRQDVVAQLSEHLHLLYDDTACVTALEQFYRQAIPRSTMA